MASIKTIKYVCPHCGKKAKSLFGVPQRKLEYYGCTARRCKSCGGVYSDQRIKEIGLFDKEETYPRWNEFYMGWVLYYAMAVIGYGAIAFQQKSITGSGIFYLAAVLLGGYVLQILTNLLTLNWRKQRWQEEYERSLAHLRKEPDISADTERKPGKSSGSSRLLTIILLAAALIVFIIVGVGALGGRSYDQQMRAVLKSGDPSGFGKGNALVAYDEDSGRYTDQYIPSDLRTDDPAQVCAIVYVSRGTTPSLGGIIQTYRTIGFTIRDAVSGELLSTYDDVRGGEDGLYPGEQEVTNLVAEKWSAVLNGK